MLTEEVYLQDKVIFITGATGTIGGGFLSYLVQNFYEVVKEIRILSRDEYKLSKLLEEFRDYKKISPKLGDIRDLEVLKRYTRGVDVLIHSAALKRVEFGEYYPYELVKTNIEGTKNIVDICIENRVEKAILVSTDKAVEPTSTYGATKLCSEKIFISANLDERNNFETLFSVVRFGNVINSRGSIFEIVKERKAKGEPIYITDLNMTRFWITIEEASRFILKVLNIMVGGEIFIPKMQSSKVIDVVKVLYPKASIVETTPRPGEKVYEKLVSEYEQRICFEDEDYFVVYPDIINDRRPFQNTYIRNLHKVQNTQSFSSKDSLSLEGLDPFEKA
ncbi:MAG: polysaccharide biosynthesis protein [Spirochaetia bacterium]|nr:polysaccharide biosynthesis protein [Spirochaetota bacterium]MCX8097117.1 polysaccharide biosynthesis protein [Spirochaetota bacterium]MDW8112113.1 polysaccharide biosynthesis protein [Spirochaetia bacterium]